MGLLREEQEVLALRAVGRWFFDAFLFERMMRRAGLW